jgi:hypothetical protein
MIIDVSVSDPKSLWGFQTESPAEAAALAAARNASPLFKIFSDYTSPIRCTITSGGPAPRQIAAACSTNYDRASHAIKFRERWPILPLRNGHWPPGTKIADWTVTVGGRGRVQSIRQTGDTPPQLWK